MDNASPLISIITVVYNDDHHLLKTIQSVAGQTYGPIQYIIIDGGSTDQSVDIIRDNKAHISEWISEKDEGLYDAMNKGLRMAEGDYVWFLNSGDEIYSPDTLENALRDLSDRPGFIYGDTVITDIEGREIGSRRLRPTENLNWRSFRKGMVVCHQAMIVRRDIAPEYNLDYQISSDIDWAIRSARKAGRLHYTGIKLAKFMEGGLSRQKLRTALKERFRILSRYYGFLPTLARHTLFGFRLAGYYLVHRRI
jgi:glycosyltransferase involved in cell wall biosynthesis